jgi:nucleoside-diphosphate-sugar epimerase
MKIFLTGASGFIGTATARMLLKQGHTVYAMSRSEASDKAIDATGSIPIRCQLNEVTIEHLQQSEIVIHAAAMVESWGDKKEFWNTNVEGTRQLATIAKTAGVKKFIHISTEAVLWTGKNLIDIDERTPYSTSTSYQYGETKREAEKLVVAANETGLFETIVVRPRLVWGPEDKTILPAAIAMYKKGHFTWINKGQAKTSSSHIYNVVEGIRLAIEKGKGGQIYFITDDEISTLNNFFTTLFSTQGIIIKAGSMPAWLVNGAASIVEPIWKLLGIKSAPPITKTAAYLMSCDCTIRNDKAKQELGYQPVITVEEGIKELAASFKLTGTYR